MPERPIATTPALDRLAAGAFEAFCARSVKTSAQEHRWLRFEIALTLRRLSKLRGAPTGDGVRKTDLSAGYFRAVDFVDHAIDRDSGDRQLARIQACIEQPAIHAAKLEAMARQAASAWLALQPPETAKPVPAGADGRRKFAPQALAQAGFAYEEAFHHDRGEV